MLKAYGVIKTEGVNTIAAEEIHRLGYTILHNLVPQNICAETRERIDFVYSVQEKESTQELLLSIQEKDLARLPLSYDEWFFQFLKFSEIKTLISALLGDYHILNLQNAIINRPSIQHHQAAWHRDLPYQNWVCSRPLAINALFCIDDFNEETGGTYVLPHTHRVESFPSAEYVKRHEQPVTAKAGSVIIFDAMLFHRAGSNTSNKIRRGLNHMYTIPLLKQQISIPRALASSINILPTDLYQLLGFDAEEPETVSTWRKKRSNKLKK